MGEIRALASQHFGRPRFIFVPAPLYAAAAAMLKGVLREPERKLLNEIGLYLPYLTDTMLFDAARTQRDCEMGARAASGDAVGARREASWRGGKCGARWISFEVMEPDRLNSRDGNRS